MAKAQKRHPIFSTIELLRDHTPFEPFEVLLSSGRSIGVHQPTDIALNKLSDIAVFFDRGGVPHMVNLRTVNEVVPLNGKHKKGSSNN